MALEQIRAMESIYYLFKHNIYYLLLDNENYYNHNDIHNLVFDI